MPRKDRRKNPPTVGLRTLLAKTCIECGVLKSPWEFRIRDKGYYVSACKDCVSVDHNKRRSANMQDMSMAAANRYQLWTDQDFRDFDRYLEEGLTYRQIGKKMSRSIRALTAMKFKLKENADG